MGLELKALARDAMLGALAQQFGLANNAALPGELPSAVIAGVLRRIAVTTCPCPREAIVSIAVDALTGIGDAEEIKQRVRAMLDSLVIIGDLHELGGTRSLPGVVAEDWLYCAPPAYVVRDGSILLLGIEPEDQAALPASLRSRVVQQRELRYLPAEADERIESQLRTAGYLEISKVAWTRAPQNQTVEEFLGGVVRRLLEADHRGTLEGLKVYAPRNGSRHYASRLGSPDQRSGYHVGRRPQAFGAPIWVFVELDHGCPVRFLDLPWRGGKFRGCDHAWRILSALDAKSGDPQPYRMTSLGGTRDQYEFFSPLPLWIERKLMLLGEKVHVKDTLFAYTLDRQDGYDINELVQNYMWFQQID